MVVDEKIVMHIINFLKGWLYMHQANVALLIRKSPDYVSAILR